MPHHPTHRMLTCDNPSSARPTRTQTYQVWSQHAEPASTHTRGATRPPPCAATRAQALRTLAGPRGGAAASDAGASWKGGAVRGVGVDNGWLPRDVALGAGSIHTADVTLGAGLIHTSEDVALDAGVIRTSEDAALDAGVIHTPNDDALDAGVIRNPADAALRSGNYRSASPAHALRPTSLGDARSPAATTGHTATPPQRHTGSPSSLPRSPSHGVARTLLMAASSAPSQRASPHRPMARSDASELHGRRTPPRSQRGRSPVAQPNVFGQWPHSSSPPCSPGGRYVGAATVDSPGGSSGGRYAGAMSGQRPRSPSPPRSPGGRYVGAPTVGSPGRSSGGRYAGAMSGQRPRSPSPPRSPGGRCVGAATVGSPGGSSGGHYAGAMSGQRSRSTSPARSPGGRYVGAATVGSPGGSSGGHYAGAMSGQRPRSPSPARSPVGRYVGAATVGSPGGSSGGRYAGAVSGQRPRSTSPPRSPSGRYVGAATVGSPGGSSGGRYAVTSLHLSSRHRQCTRSESPPGSRHRGSLPSAASPSWPFSARGRGHLSESLRSRSSRCDHGVPSEVVYLETSGAASPRARGFWSGGSGAKQQQLAGVTGGTGDGVTGQLLPCTSQHVRVHGDGSAASESARAWARPAAAASAPQPQPRQPSALFSTGPAPAASLVALPPHPVLFEAMRVLRSGGAHADTRAHTHAQPEPDGDVQLERPGGAQPWQERVERPPAEPGKQLEQLGMQLERPAGVLDPEPEGSAT
eukprot:365701-Chlamydomonas_euryale.AAC.3